MFFAWDPERAGASRTGTTSKSGTTISARASCRLCMPRGARPASSLTSLQAPSSMSAWLFALFRCPAASSSTKLDVTKQHVLCDSRGPRSHRDARSPTGSEMLGWLQLRRRGAAIKDGVQNNERLLFFRPLRRRNGPRFDRSRAKLGNTPNLVEVATNFGEIQKTSPGQARSSSPQTLAKWEPYPLPAPGRASGAEEGWLF